MTLSFLTVTDAAWVAVVATTLTRRVTIQENGTFTKPFLVSPVANGTGLKKVAGARYVFEMGERKWRAGYPVGYVRLQAGGGSVEFYQDEQEQ